MSIRPPGKDLNKQQRPGLADVARQAGVSTATVSRVLNAPDKVRPGTRMRVEAAIEQLAYVPDGAARGLASGRLRSIGAIVPTLDNAIFATCIGTLQRCLDARGFSLLIATSEYDPALELRSAQALLSRGIDGLMLVGNHHPDALNRYLQRSGLPCVRTWVYDPGQPTPTIGFDNQAAAARVASYLLDLGHRRIGMIAGQTDRNDRAAARVAGVRSALAARGVLLPEALLVQRPYDIAAGREGLRTLLAHPQPPTAVICGNDVLALGALLETQALAVPVPEALSITGFDDLPIAGNLVPALTTVRVPAAELGRRTADFLLARLEGLRPPAHTELPVDLVVRGTTMPPPATQPPPHQLAAPSAQGARDALP